MRRSLVIVGIASLGLFFASGCASHGQYTPFGESMKLSDRDSIPVKDVLADPVKYAGQRIRVTGTVDEVCANKGCWIRLGAAKSAENLFVKFTCPVEGRLVPMSAVGRTAVVEGTLEIKKISEAEARHFKEDAGASPEEIAKIAGPQKQLRMNAPAALVAK